jgi:arylsulfatase A-like enzyme
MVFDSVTSDDDEPAARRSLLAKLTVGFPGSPHGIPDWTPTIADLLKEQGYTTAQFGKNHLGDNNKHLPTLHGFDEFFGNLYHVNAEEEPETYYYPKDPAFKAQFGPRGVLHSWAADKDDPTVDPRRGKVVKQRIEDTGPLTRERMPRVVSMGRRNTKLEPPWH